jgi:hypothetical protein
MAGTKLTKLKQEISHYINLPYMRNTIKDGVVVKKRFLGGKGSWQEIKKQTIFLAKKEKVDLNKLTPRQLYNFQKKHHLGIDCSGLVSQLLNFYFNSHLNPRQTSADMLTSTKLSKKIDDYNDIQTGDLVRQKNGHHVLFIIEKQNQKIYYVDSSHFGRGVKYGQFDINDQSFDNQGIYRLFFFN